MGSKHVFWQALLSAVLIFGVGVLLGIGFEDARNKGVNENLLNSEISALDSKLMGEVTGSFDISCEITKMNLIEFADNVFAEAKQLEKYEENSKFTETLQILHRKYDLLRVELWTQAIKAKEKCSEEFHTVVYIYKYKTDNGPTLKARQIVFSRVLEDIKKKHGDRIILIPIAGDLELKSIELIKDSYGINKYPAVILDETKVIDDEEELANIENLLFE